MFLYKPSPLRWGKSLQNSSDKTRIDGCSLYPSIFVWNGFSGCYQKDSWTFHRVPAYAIKIMEFSEELCQSHLRRSNCRCVSPVNGCSFPHTQGEKWDPSTPSFLYNNVIIFHFPYWEEGYLKVVVQCGSFTLHSTSSSLLASKLPSMKKLILKATINKKACSV